IRLNIAKTKAIFTQDYILRDQKKLPMYEKVVAAKAPRTIVLSSDEKLTIDLRDEDLSFEQFLKTDDEFSAYQADPMMPCNILFSSGTTGTPKAIPWSHSTPIKSASDAFLHHDIQNDDILTWPTSLGWM